MLDNASHVKPSIGENRFGGESVTYEGIGATKKWERIESYGPKYNQVGFQRFLRAYLPLQLAEAALPGTLPRIQHP